MIIYAVSDSIGETAEQVAKATARQFQKEVKVKRIPYLNSREDTLNFINSLECKECMIISTIVIAEVRDFLVQQAVERGIHIVNILGPCVTIASRLLEEEPMYEPGGLRKLDDEYYRKIEAMEFAITFDDSKDDRGIKNADVVIIGLSRTSKTPLCAYLANKGIKAANVPLVPEVPLPQEIFEVDRKKIIGLTINPLVLMDIRKNRLSRMGSLSGIQYANTERILTEMEYSEKTMKKLRCKVIDVTHKAIEETAGLIMDYIGWDEQ